MATQKKKAGKPIVIHNKKARFAYTCLDTYTAGLVLQGTEIKSIKAGQASLQEAYCYLAQEELFITGMHIAAYAQGNRYNHVETRTRKLLLQKRELKKLMKTQEKGFTIIPLRLFVTERGWAKLQIALAKGKKQYDKRQAIKERDLKRSLRQEEALW